MSVIIQSHFLDAKHNERDETTQLLTSQNCCSWSQPIRDLLVIILLSYTLLSVIIRCYITTTVSSVHLFGVVACTSVVICMILALAGALGRWLAACKRNKVEDEEQSLF